jgi:hypothetical protein
MMLSAVTLAQLGAKMKCDRCGKRPERYYPANQSDTPGVRSKLLDVLVSATFGRSFLLAVPELTRSVGIQLNERVSLRRRCKILSSSQSCGLAALSHAYRAIRGRC